MADRETNERLKNLKNDYRAVFFGSSIARQGQRVLQDILQLTGVMATCIAQDQRMTDVLLGKRQAGLDIMELLDVRGYDGLKEMERHNLGISEMFVDPYNDKERQE